MRLHLNCLLTSCVQRGLYGRRQNKTGHSLSPLHPHPGPPYFLTQEELQDNRATTTEGQKHLCSLHVGLPLEHLCETVVSTTCGWLVPGLSSTQQRCTWRFQFNGIAATRLVDFTTRYGSRRRARRFRAEILKPITPFIIYNIRSQISLCSVQNLCPVLF